MSALTKQELITKLSGKSGMTLKEAHDAIQFVLDEIRDALSANRKVELRDFGIFKLAYRAERKGRNPANPESGTVTIPARWVVKFRPGAELGKVINQEPPPPAPTPAAA